MAMTVSTLVFLLVCARGSAVSGSESGRSALAQIDNVCSLTSTECCAFHSLGELDRPNDKWKMSLDLVNPAQFHMVADDLRIPWPHPPGERAPSRLNRIPIPRRIESTTLVPGGGNFMRKRNSSASIQSMRLDLVCLVSDDLGVCKAHEVWKIMPRSMLIENANERFVDRRYLFGTFEWQSSSFELTEMQHYSVLAPLWTPSTAPIPIGSNR